MAAITTTLFAMLSKGAHVVVTDDAYRRTRQFLLQILRRYGVEVTVVPAGDYERLEEAIRPTTRLLFSESPTNPYNRILDLERVADIGRRHRVKTIIDSTFATPINQRPLEFGIDLVIHSATKYLGGHNDLLAGAVLGSAPLIGGDPRPAGHHRRGARSVRRLPADPRHQDAGAAGGAAERERGAPGGVPGRRTRRSSASITPSLPSHPGARHRARARCSGFGGVVSFEIAGDLAAGSRLVDACRIPRIAPSLGGVESLIEQPALMSFFELSTEERLQVGIKDSLIRYSVGIEDADDLIADLAPGARRGLNTTDYTRSYPRIRGSAPAGRERARRRARRCRACRRGSSGCSPARRSRAAPVLGRVGEVVERGAEGLARGRGCRTR